MYKSLIEVEKKRQSTSGSTDAPLLGNDVPRGYFVKNRNLAALSTAGFATTEGKTTKSYRYLLYKLIVPLVNLFTCVNV